MPNITLKQIKEICEKNGYCEKGCPFYIDDKYPSCYFSDGDFCVKDWDLEEIQKRIEGNKALGDVVEYIQLRCDYDKCATDKDTCHECSRNTNYQDLYKEIE